MEATGVVPTVKKKSNSESSSVWWDFFVTKFLVPVNITTLLFATALLSLLLIHGSKESAIDAKLKSGAVPAAVFSETAVQEVDRPDLVQLIRDSFLTQQPQTYLGLVSF